MSWYEFIFSEKLSHRTRRHLVFWLLWWIYFAATYYYYLQVGLQAIVWGKLNLILLAESLLLVLLHLIVCYFFLYILLPRYFIKKKYLQAIAGICFIAFFLISGGYFVHSILFPIIDPLYHSKISSNNTLWWTNINSGLLSAPKVIAAATVIKLIKRWYLKQKEKERIEREKLATDLQLMKAQIRPAFLFSSLEQIYNATQNDSPRAPELLLKLSDLLSYLLYECDEPKVSLAKEISMMKEYMMLEKARFGEKIDLEIVIKGDIDEQKIAPLLLLPFIENSFKYCCNDTEQPWINLEICIHHDILSMKLLNGVAPVDTAVSWDGVTNIEKRLQLLYPGKHELKKYIEQEIYVVLLRIDLGNYPSKEPILSKVISGRELNKDYAYN